MSDSDNNERCGSVDDEDEEEGCQGEENIDPLIYSNSRLMMERRGYSFKSGLRDITEFSSAVKHDFQLKGKNKISMDVLFSHKDLPPCLLKFQVSKFDTKGFRDLIKMMRKRKILHVILVYFGSKIFERLRKKETEEDLRIEFIPSRILKEDILRQ